MRIITVGSILLLSSLAECRITATHIPKCVEDCNKFLVERYLALPQDRCTTAEGQKALFQCLINICNAESYGPALAHSVSTCLDAGTHIIPLHPIEVRQRALRKDHLSDDMAEHDQLDETIENYGLGFALARRLSVALACNAGSDGLVTVSIAPAEPTASNFAAENTEKSETMMTGVVKFATTLPKAAPQPSANDAIHLDNNPISSDQHTTECNSVLAVQHTPTSTTSWSRTTTSDVSSTSCTLSLSQLEQRTSSSSTTTESQSSTSSTSLFSSSTTTSQSSRHWTSSESTSHCTDTSVTTSHFSSTTSTSTSSSLSTEPSSWTFYPQATSTSTTKCSESRFSSVTSTESATFMPQTSTSSGPSWSTSTISSSWILSSEPCTSESSTTSRSETYWTFSTATYDVSSTSCVDSYTITGMQQSVSSSQSCTSTDTEWSFYRISSTTTDYSSQSGSNLSTRISTPYPSWVTESLSFTPQLQAYTFATSSLPPSYESIPPIEEYGYGTPPPMYEIPSPTQSSQTPSSSSSSSSRFSTQSTTTTWYSSDTPAMYETTSSGLTQMLNVAPVPRPTGENSDWIPITEAGTATDQSNQTSALAHPSTATEGTVTSHKLSPTIDPDQENSWVDEAVVTMISLLAGHGMHTTVVTIQQQEAAGTKIPSLIALNEPGESQANKSISDEESKGNAPESSAALDELGPLSTESPLSAMLMGQSPSVSINPICVWVAAMTTTIAVLMGAVLA